MHNKIILFETSAYKKFFKPSKRLKEAQELFARSLDKALRAKLKDALGDTAERSRLRRQANELSLVFTLIATRANKREKAFRQIGEKLRTDSTLMLALLDKRFADRGDLLEGVIRALVSEVYYYPLFEHWLSFEDAQKDALIESLAKVGYQLSEYFRALAIKNGLLIDKARRKERSMRVVDPEVRTIEQLQEDTSLSAKALERLTLSGGEYATFAYIDVVGGLATRMGPEVQVIWGEKNSKDTPREGTVFFASTFFNDETKNIIDRSEDMRGILLTAEELKASAKGIIESDPKKKHLLDFKGGAYAVDVADFAQFKSMLSTYNTLSGFHLWALNDIARRLKDKDNEAVRPKDHSIAYPKGAYGLGQASESYFEIKAWGIRELEQRLKKKVPYVLVTSPDNDQMTREYLRANNFFGLDEDQVILYSQEDVFPQVYKKRGTAEEYAPVYNKDGKIVLKAKGHYVSKEVLACLKEHKDRWWPDLKDIAAKENVPVERAMDLIPVINFNIENLAANYNGLKTEFFLPMVGKLIADDLDVIAITADIMEGPTEKAGRIVGLKRTVRNADGTKKDIIVNRNIEYNDNRFTDIKKYEYRDSNGDPFYFVRGIEDGKTVVMVLTPKEVEAHLVPNPIKRSVVLAREKGSDLEPLFDRFFTDPDAEDLTFKSDIDKVLKIVDKKTDEAVQQGDPLTDELKRTMKAILDQHKKTNIAWRRSTDSERLHIEGFDPGTLMLSSRYDIETNFLEKQKPFVFRKGIEKGQGTLSVEDRNDYTITYNYANTNIFLTTAGYLDREYNTTERFYKDSTPDDPEPLYKAPDRPQETGSPLKLEGGYFNILDGAGPGKSLVVKFTPKQFFLASKERWHVEKVLKDITPYFYEAFGGKDTFVLEQDVDPEDVRIMISPLFAADKEELRKKIGGKITLGKDSSIVLNFSGDTRIEGGITVEAGQSLVIQNARGYKKGDEVATLTSSVPIVVKENEVWNDLKVITVGAGKVLHFNASHDGTNTYALRKSLHAIRASKVFPVLDKDFTKLVADMRIVVLDDDETYLSDTRKQLEAIGVDPENIVTYTSPREFLDNMAPGQRLTLDSTRKRKPNLVISDFKLTGGAQSGIKREDMMKNEEDSTENGLKVFQKLHEREENKHVQFLLVTGTAGEFKDVTGLSLGKAIYNPYFGWLSKAVFNDKDNRVLREILEGSLIP